MIDEPTNAAAAFRPADAAHELIRSEKGAIVACDHNACLLMANDDELGDLHFDEFLNTIRIGDRDWLDADDRELLCKLQWKHNVPRFSLAQVHNAVMVLAYARRRDSLQDFVFSLPEWDGTDRLELALVHAWGAPDTPFVRAASRNFFISLIARAVQPGAKVDHVLILEGPQGSKKSESLSKLGGQFYAEIAAAIGTMDFARELRGIWLADMSELDSLRGREASAVKRWVSARSDRFVEKYERHAKTYPRRAVCCGTTNEGAYWGDTTGARRLIPVCVGEIDLGLIEEMRLQWFAEALVRFRKGQRWWELPADAVRVQDERQIQDPWEDILRQAITHGRKTGVGTLTWPDGWISSTEIMREWLRLEPHQQGQASSARLGRVMRRLGFEPQRQGKERARGWSPVSTEVSAPVSP